MGSSESYSSSPFPILDPIIVDDAMENAYCSTDMQFLDPSKLEVTSDGEKVDAYIAGDGTRRIRTADTSQLPAQRSYPRRDTLKKFNVVNATAATSTSPTDSPTESARSSSSDSPPRHARDSSSASSAANGDAVTVPHGYMDGWDAACLAGTTDDAALFGVSGTYALDTDIESSNKVMDAAFDFESAASGGQDRLKTEPGGAYNKTRSQALDSSVQSRQAADRLVKSPVSFASISSLFRHQSGLTLIASLLCLGHRLGFRSFHPPSWQDRQDWALPNGKDFPPRRC